MMEVLVASSATSVAVVAPRAGAVARGTLGEPTPLRELRAGEGEPARLPRLALRLRARALRASSLSDMAKEKNA